jgi:hypothetical protein
MFKPLKTFLATVVALGLCAFPSSAATSAVPGTLNYVEGQVRVAGQPVTSKSVGSVQLEPNQAIETGRGKAEMLLTPGVFLRIGDDSAVRMVSPELLNTRVQVLRGEAMVEATEVPKDSNIRVLLDGASAKLNKHGVYDFNANAGQVRVFDGKATVERDDQQVKLKKGRMVALAGPFKAEKFDTKVAEQQNELYAWSRLRSEYDSEAAMQTASTVVVGGPGWWGAGWYWNPWWGMYSYLPGDGYLYSPFGWPYYSPVFIYSTPGFYYGHAFRRGFAGRGFVGHGFVGHGFRGGGAAPHTGGGFAGRGFAGGGLHGGGFHR